MLRLPGSDDAHFKFIVFVKDAEQEGRSRGNIGLGGPRLSLTKPNPWRLWRGVTLGLYFKRKDLDGRPVRTRTAGLYRVKGPRSRTSNDVNDVKGSLTTWKYG
jgi:hypothetical protein